MRRALGLVCFMIACGGGDDNGPPAVSTNKDNVCGTIASVACYDMYTCCAEGEIERFLGVTDPRTEDQCREDVTKLCERRIATFTFSITNNRVTFDGSIMNACLKSLLVGNVCATVDTMLPWAMPCLDSAWVGAVADGGTCDYPYECASVDSYCASNKSCTAKPGLSQPCTFTPGCATGLYCAGSTCQMQSGAGGMCSSTTQCMKGLICDFSTSPAMCVAPKDGGQPCTSNQSCKSNVCTPGTCAGTNGSCYRNTDCYGHCSNNGSFCTQDYNCGIGHCSITTTKSCQLPTDCLTTDGTCILPNQCVPGQCTGNIVCTDAHLTVDYCSGALNALPIPR